jgi:hypothetical protein
MRIQSSFAKSAIEQSAVEQLTIWVILNGLHKLFALWSMICLLLTLTVQSAGAHGEDRTLYLSDVVVGSYTISAWTSPAVLRTGEIHIEVSLLDMNGVPVQDALVYVTVSPLDGMGEPLSVLAHPDHSSYSFSQEAAFWLDQPGNCRVDITVADLDGHYGNTSFDIEILSVPLAVRALLYVQIGASLIAGIWIVKVGIGVWFRPVLREIT